jgi:hypothetical protein
MILGLSAPFQDHGTTVTIARISEVVWECIADIGHIPLFLAEMEVPREHPLKSAKMFHTDFAMIGHFYHGVHLEMRQLEMSKHVLGRHLLDALVIISHQPRCYDHITFVQPIVADVYVGYVPGPGRAVYVAAISVVEIVIARYEIELIERLAQSFQGPQAEVQGLEVDRRSMVVPIAQEQTSLAAMLTPDFDHPIHETGAVLVV